VFCVVVSIFNLSNYNNDNCVRYSDFHVFGSRPIYAARPEILSKIMQVSPTSFRIIVNFNGLVSGILVDLVCSNGHAIYMLY